MTFADGRSMMRSTTREPERWRLLDRPRRRRGERDGLGFISPSLSSVGFLSEGDRDAMTMVELGSGTKCHNSDEDDEHT